MTNEEAIRRILEHKRVHSLNEPRAVLINEALDLAIEALKKRPQGEWIIAKQDTILGNFEVKNKVCDQCNHATKYEYPFCPWCGADMRTPKK